MPHLYLSKQKIEEMAARGLPEKKDVYEAVQSIFTGQNAQVSKPKAIRNLIERHNDQDLLVQLLQQHSLDDVTAITKSLIDDNVFSSNGWMARSALVGSRGQQRDRTEVYREQTAKPTAETICGKCARINFGSIFDETSVPEGGVLVAHLGRNAGSWDTSTCPLCRLFAWVRTPHPHNPEYLPSLNKDLGYCLYAMPALTLFDIYGALPIQESGIVNNTVLGVFLEKDVAEGRVRDVINKENPDFICSVRDRGSAAGIAINGRCVDADRMSPTLVKGWLEYCDANHTDCSDKALYGDASEIVKFQVIDCEARRVIPLPPGQPYAALSYVWGKQEHPEQAVDDTGRLEPGSLPVVIEDAVTVTLQAGLQYLWVDKYCIFQDDEEIRQIQLQAMDRVYKLAHFTMYAAAGSDATYGLPGAGSRSRKKMAPQVISKGITLAKVSLTRAHFARLITQSEWIKRAWTYQEAIFARRRVFFTDLGVYFECGRMWCSEHLDEEPSIRHYRHTPNPTFPQMNNDMSVEHMAQSIEQYSRRKLTFEHDKLHAFLGVLEHFSKMTKPLYHLQGVPLLASKLMAERSNALTAFVNGLSWATALPTTRREGFPSWSWTGWQFKAGYSPDVHAETTAMEEEKGLTGSNPSRSFHVWLQKRDGAVIPFPGDMSQFAAFQAAHSFRLTQYIHIEAWTVELRFEDSGIPWGHRHNRPAMLRGNDTHEPYFVPFKGTNGHTRPGLDGDFFWALAVDRGQPGKAYIRLDLTLDSGTGDVATRLVTETWTGIVLPTMDAARIMVVDFAGDVAERIGCISMVPGASRWRARKPGDHHDVLPPGAPGASVASQRAELGAQVGALPNKELKMRMLNEVTGMTEEQRHAHSVPWSHVMETFHGDLARARRGIWLG